MPKLVSYNRFVELMQGAVIPLVILLKGYFFNLKHYFRLFL
ncbi:hypothetical protein [Candidatus Midichloria mitochondrii]|nr:hypothetical protein [Candidatus Midichloria mitochondrii]